MDEKCDICGNFYEVCEVCKKYGVNLKGCVEDKKTGFHDNGGYIPDSEEESYNTGSWVKEKK